MMIAMAMMKSLLSVVTVGLLFTPISSGSLSTPPTPSPTRSPTYSTTTSEPTTSEPTTSEPTTSEPTTSEPTTSEPTTSEPTTPTSTEGLFISEIYSAGVNSLQFIELYNPTSIAIDFRQPALQLRLLMSLPGFDPLDDRQFVDVSPYRRTPLLPGETHVMCSNNTISQDEVIVVTDESGTNISMRADSARSQVCHQYFNPAISIDGDDIVFLRSDRDLDSFGAVAGQPVQVCGVTATSPFAMNRAYFVTVGSVIWNDNIELECPWETQLGSLVGSPGHHNCILPQRSSSTTLRGNQEPTSSVAEETSRTTTVTPSPSSAPTTSPSDSSMFLDPSPSSSDNLGTTYAIIAVVVGVFLVLIGCVLVNCCCTKAEGKKSYSLKHDNGNFNATYAASTDTVVLKRHSGARTFGFSVGLMSNGDRVVAQVQPRSSSEGYLNAGDRITAINGILAPNLTDSDYRKLLSHDHVELEIERSRSPSGMPFYGEHQQVSDNLNSNLSNRFSPVSAASPRPTTISLASASISQFESLSPFITESTKLKLTEQSRVDHPDPRDIHEIVLERHHSSEAFGFHIGSWDSGTGVDSQRVMITSTKPTSVADYRLQVGDRILKVNGKDVNNLNHDEVLKRITTSGASVTLTVLRTVFRPVITLQKGPHKSFGFGLATTHDDKVMISQVMKDSPADGALQVGDLVLSVNKTHTSEVDHEFLTQTLANSSTAVLEIERDTIEQDFKMMHVTVTKGDKGFGAHISGAMDQPDVVTRVEIGGPSDGVLEKGDTILRLNGISTREWGIDQLMDELAKLQYATFTITRRIHEASLMSMGHIQNHDNPIDFTPGDLVTVQSRGNGIVRYVGAHHVTKKKVVGIELDLPVGVNNGTVGNYTYFSCSDLRGVLVEPGLVSLGSVQHQFDEDPIDILCPVSDNDIGMGLTIVGPLPGEVKTGCFISKVREGSPAAHIDELRPGMLILAIGNKRTLSLDQYQMAVLLRTLENMNLGGTISLRLQFRPDSFAKHDGGELLRCCRAVHPRTPTIGTFDEPTEITVPLNGSDSLGISVLGPDDLSTPIGCYIQTVIPNGPAHRARVVKRGMLVHAVNDIDCLSATEPEIVEIIKSQTQHGQAAVRLTLENHFEGFDRRLKAYETSRHLAT